MKRLLLTAALAAAVITPTAASAADTPAQNAAKYCKELKSASGGANFVAMFGTKKNAYGKCVSQTARKTASGEQTKREQADRISAAKSCKTAKKDAEQFGKDYGTKKNAFGKCVSKTAREMAAERKASDA